MRHWARRRRSTHGPSETSLTPVASPTRHSMAGGLHLREATCTYESRASAGKGVRQSLAGSATPPALPDPRPAVLRFQPAHTKGEMPTELHCVTFRGNCHGASGDTAGVPLQAAGNSLTPWKEVRPHWSGLQIHVSSRLAILSGDFPLRIHLNLYV